MRVPGFARLYTGLLLGRMGGSMLYVALVLFVLQRYHSPQLAGATAFMPRSLGSLCHPSPVRFSIDTDVPGSSPSTTRWPQ